MDNGQSTLQDLLGMNSGRKIVKNPGVTYLGRGVDMSDVGKEFRISIRDAERSGHLGCFGTTRVGKTRLIETLVDQDIKKGYNIVMVDPKGDVELFSRIVQSAAEAGRLEEMLLLTPVYPDHSIMLDPLSYYYMEDELVDHVVSGIKAREDYYISVATEVTTAIVEGLVALARHKGEKLNINFHDIKKRSDYLSLKHFKEELETVPGTQEIVDSLEQILHSPQDFFAKVSSSLRMTLSALTSGSAGRVIGKARHNEFIRRFEEGRGVIFFCNTGSMLARRTAHIIGKVVISMIQSLLGRFYSSGRKLDPPLCIHIDEGHNILYRGVQELFNKGGGANVWVHLYTQSIAQVVEEIGDDAAQSIVDNINTWIYMLVNHPETARHIEDSSPLVTKHQAYLSFGGGITIRQAEEKQIPAFRVMQLRKREFYMRSYGKLYKGVTEDVPPLHLKIKFPDIMVVNQG